MRRPTTGAPEFGKANFYAAGKTGFTEGTPGVEAATVVTDDTLNHLVGELCNAIEVFGATALDALKYDQLATVLAGALTRGIVASAQNDVRTGFLNTTGLTVGGTGIVTDLQARSPGGGIPQLVAVGGTAGTAVLLRYSNDLGATWAASTPGSAYNNQLIGTCDTLVYGLGGEIQVAVYSGNNPTTYTRQKTGGNDITTMCKTPDNAFYMAIDTAGRMWTKTIAASSWTDNGVKLGVGTVKTDLAPGFVAGTGYIAVCDNGQIKRSSNNGSSWAAVSIPASGVAKTVIYTGQPGFEWVAGCDPGGFYKSSDLVTWTAITPAVPATYAYALTPIVGGFMAFEYQPPYGAVTHDGATARFIEGINIAGFIGGTITTQRLFRYQRLPFASLGVGGQVLLTVTNAGSRVSRMAEAFPPPAGVYP